MRPLSWLSTSCAVTTLLACGFVPLDAQTRSETIRGRVLADSGQAIGGAEVRVTRAPDRAFQIDTTDASGAYSVTFAEGTGDYLIHVGASGWQPVRKRLTKAGGDPVLELDVTLQSEKAVQLRALVVRPQRARPPRAAEIGPGTGAAESLVDGVPAALSPDQEGDLAAVAATVPGANVVGVPPGQNQVTLNGMAFAAGEIPREARTRTRVSNSTYDPARGGFSGTQTAVELATGGIYSFRRGHATIDAPQLQGADAGANALGGRYRNLQLSAGGEGELVRDKFFYNAAVQASRRTSDIATLGSASREALRTSGASADSVARLIGLLDAFGIPAGVRGGDATRTSESVSLLARVDHTPGAVRTWGTTVYGKLTRSDAIGAGPAATLATAGSTSSAIGAVQGVYSRYFRRFYLNETRTSLTYGVDRGEPYLNLPYGRVQLTSELGGSGALASLGFGGNGVPAYSRTDWTWETTNETQWQGWANAHRLKVHLQSRLDGYSRSGASSLGTFTFSSLEDLAANRPSSFTRLIGAPGSSGVLWSGAAAFGDLWRASPKFQMLYGVRLEGNRYLSGAPRNNPEVEAAFGVRNDALPNAVHLSPRIGFTWAYGGAGGQAGIRTTALGTQYQGPTGALRGGVGEFRSLMPADLASAAAMATGLPGSSRRVACVGAAVPTPDWRAYAADRSLVPDTCSGTETDQFADFAPAVQLLDPSYDAPRSWRANLAWSSQYGRLGFSVEGIYSLGLNQPGQFDLNFTGVPRFVLREEGGRPVYVGAASVVPATGATTGMEARRDAAFGRVVQLESDLRTVSRQVTVLLTPEIRSPNYFARFAYTLGSARAQSRGFDGAGFGDPAAREWAPSDFDVRHQMQVQAGWATRHVRLTLFGRLASGTPFSPLVSGDVNGDGLASDRAFVFHPERTASPAMRDGMEALLASGPEWARECLQRGLGRAAERNGCRGPWTQTLNARIDLVRRVPLTRNRVDLGINVANPLAGVDLLLHGSRGLRGWGYPARPDPVLYRVRGFDPAAQAFRYEVNPRFGDTRSRLLGNPFRITIDARVELGRPLQVQQLQRALRAGRGGDPRPRLSVDSLVARYTRSVPDLYAMTLQLSDSLLLAPEQAEALKAAQAGYRERMTVVWRELAEYLAALPESYDAGEALRRQEAAIDQGWEISRLEGPTFKAILSPMQQKMLPSLVESVINATEKVRIRYFLN